MEIISREEAIEKGLVRYYTGEPCKYGHITQRRTINKRCMQCHREDSRKRYANPSKKKIIDEKNKQWAVENRDKSNKIKKTWEKNNSQKVKRSRAIYKKKHTEIIRFKRKEYNSREETKLKNRSNTVAYRAGLGRATPKWISRHLLTDVYKKCRQINKNSAHVYEVDHIVPLRNDFVCGLHVPWNLQIITRKQNRSKSNKWETN